MVVTVEVVVMVGWAPENMQELLPLPAVTVAVVLEDMVVREVVVAVVLEDMVVLEVVVAVVMVGLPLVQEVTVEVAMVSEVVMV